MAEDTPTAPAAPAPPAPAKPWYTPLLDFFSSVHVAVVILLLLATIAIIGTVLQQESMADPAENLRLFRQFFSNPSTADRAYAISEKLGFYRLYQTWYFYTLLGLLSTSLIVCSLRRLPMTIQVMGRPKVELDDAGFKASPNRRSAKVRLPLGAAADAAAGILGKAGYKVRTGERDGARYLFGQKGAYSRLGIYVTHFSIVIVFIGGLIGNIYGYKGYLQIVEGTAESTVPLRGKGNRVKELPFAVRCDDFTVEYYAGTQRPKDFYSQLTVIKDGREIRSEKIEVNSPLVQDGVWFYQSSYGDTGRGQKVSLAVSDPASGRSAELSLPVGEAREVPGVPGLRLQVRGIVPDFSMEGGRVVSRSSQPRNPAALVQVFLPDGTAKQTYLFKFRPDIKMVKEIPYDLVFKDFESLQYTGLQVVHDPGVWVIWLGCTLMVLGIYFAFFVSHRRVWVRLREEGGQTAVQLAGNANKNRESFAEAFEKLGDQVAAVAAANE